MPHLLRYIWYAFVLVVVQVFVIQNINILGPISNFFTPCIYVALIVGFPADAPRSVQYLYAFSLGLSVDMLSGTLGMHAFTSTMAMGLRELSFRWVLNRSIDTVTDVINVHTIERRAFISIAAIVVTAHHFVLFLMDDMNLVNLPWVVLRTICSSILTLAFIMFIQTYYINKKKYR